MLAATSEVDCTRAIDADNRERVTGTRRLTNFCYLSPLSAISWRCILLMCWKLLRELFAHKHSPGLLLLVAGSELVGGYEQAARRSQSARSHTDFDCSQQLRQ